MEFITIKTIKLYLRSLWKRVLLILIFVIVSGLLIYSGVVKGGDKPWGTFLISLGSAFLAIGLVTLVSEFVTSTKVLTIMRLYGDYTEHGIRRIFPSREDPEYREIRNTKLKQARCVRILTQIGREFIGSKGEIEQTKKKIQEAVEFKFLALKPGCAHWKIQYKDFEPPDKDSEPQDLDVIGSKKIKGIKANFEKLKDFTHGLNCKEKELRYYDRKPVFQIEIFDQTVFIAFYGLRSRAKYSPVLMFEKRRGSRVFQYFTRQFDNYWHRGKLHE